MSNVYRDSVIEEVSDMLERAFPDNVSTNAFCAAIRSMREPLKKQPYVGQWRESISGVMCK